MAKAKFPLPAPTLPAHRAGRPPPPGRLKLSHLRLIAAVADTGVLGAAAQSVNMSQPAASRMIAEMEALLEAQLCERLARGVRLTPLGQSLASRARGVLLQLSQAEREFADLKAGRRGVVAVGSVSAPAFDLAPAALARLRKAAPEIELSFTVDSSNTLARELLAARLDFMIGRPPDDIDARLFHTRAIGLEEAHLIVRQGHPLLSRAPADLAACADYEWILQPRGTPLRRAVDNLFVTANIPPPERFLNTTSMTLTMMLAARSDAIAPLSVAAVDFACRGVAPGALAALRTSFEIVVQPYSLITLRDRPLSPAAQAVYEILREEAAGRAL